MSQKYKAQRVTIDGISFDSTLEGARWIELRHRLKRGEIRDLQRQVPFPVHGSDGKLITTYRADFVYSQDGNTVVEDAKGLILKEFKLKAALVKEKLGIAIKVVAMKDVADWAYATAKDVRDAGITSYRTQL